MTKKHSSPAGRPPASAADPQDLAERTSRILVLEKVGKVPEAFEAACALAVEHRDGLAPVRLAVDLALRHGLRNGPAKLARALRGKSGGKLRADYALAYADLRRENHEAAHAAAEALTARHPEELEAAILLAEVRRARSDFAGAIACLEAARDSHPESGPLCHRLAGLYMQARQPDKAVDAARRARELGMTDQASVMMLASALTGAERYGEALPLLGEADSNWPNDFETLALLSKARQHMGDLEGAKNDAERALEIRPFSIRRASTKRSPGLTVLVIESCNADFFRRQRLHDYNAHNFPSHLHAPDLAMIYAPLTRHMTAALDKAGIVPDIVVNNIAVTEIIDRPMRDIYGPAAARFDDAGIPIVNRLEAVDECSREANSLRFENETGFIFPKTRSIDRASMLFDAVLALVEAEFAWPVLVRPTMSNVGEGMRLVDGADGLREALQEGDQDARYIIQYHECRGDQGFGRQLRAAVIGGDRFIDRLNTFRDFQSHDLLRRTPEWEGNGFDRDEKTCLIDASPVLGFDWKQVLAPVLEHTPLDIYGIDFGVTRDGRPIVFEINAAMNLYNPSVASWSPYLSDHYRFLNDLTVQYLRSRVKAAR